MIAIILSLLLSLGAHGSPNPALEFQRPEAIINGTNAHPSEAINQSTVLVVTTFSKCTGTLVSENTVVTAAHCLDLGGSIGVRVTHLARDRKDACATSWVKSHANLPGRSKDPEYKIHLPDIVLLQLEKPLCGTKPAKLRNQPVAVGETFRTAGYGIGTQSITTPDRIYLRSISATDNTIRDLYSDLDPANPKEKEILDGVEKIRKDLAPHYDMALAERPDQSLCSGDSGGPVYTEFGGEVELIGVNGAIVSHPKKGVRECKDAYLQLFAPVMPHVSWIQAKVKEWSR